MLFRSLRIPDKIVNLIRELYTDTVRCVRMEGDLPNWFELNSGVRQGCILAPSMFLNPMDWVLEYTRAFWERLSAPKCLRTSTTPMMLHFLHKCSVSWCWLWRLRTNKLAPLVWRSSGIKPRFRLLLTYQTSIKFKWLAVRLMKSTRLRILDAMSTATAHQRQKLQGGSPLHEI